MSTLGKAVAEVMNNAYENGYGAEIEAMSDDELAEDMIEQGGDFDGASAAEVAAAIFDIRSGK